MFQAPGIIVVLMRERPDCPEGRIEMYCNILGKDVIWAPA